MRQAFKIGKIPAILWGEPSDEAFIWVHGKESRKEYAEAFAEIANANGCQVVSFDLPQHGERAREAERCDVWNGIRDLNAIADHVFSRWRDVSLYACSLGAYFSLNAYVGRPFRRCLFQSPIVDMEYLVRQMMRWFDVSEARLLREREVDTPIDVLSWDYYQYIRNHPVETWPHPTSILYGGRDNLQSRAVIRAFTRRFSCDLVIAEDSEHPFMAEADGEIVADWIKSNLCPGYGARHAEGV